jgi:hypothetical protein
MSLRSTVEAAHLLWTSAGVNADSVFSSFHAERLVPVAFSFTVYLLVVASVGEKVRGEEEGGEIRERSRVARGQSQRFNILGRYQHIRSPILSATVYPTGSRRRSYFECRYGS